jgi:LysM repeat protein
MDWNKLQGNDLSSGQALIIKGVVDTPADSTVPSPADSRVTETKTAEKKEAPENNDQVVIAEEPPVKNTTSTDERKTVYSSGGWISHKVEKGQTLFSIAQQYNAKVEDLINWNGLSSNNLAVGQNLKVGKDQNTTVPTSTSSPSPPPAENKTVAVSTPSKESPSNTSSSNTSYKNIKEVGQAEVIEGTGNHKKYLVLHRSAPVGTIMRIRNEENDRTVFARVVGVLPETGNNNKLIIKVSKAAFDQLRAVNSRFPVEISY